MESYTRTKLNSIEDIFKLNKLFMSSFIFRGQSDTEWALETSYERNGFPLKVGYYNSEEIAMIYEFKRKYNLYSQYKQPEEDNYVEWLAIMQHYGAPTRLLDFSESPFIALYFAAIGVDKPWEIYKDENRDYQQYKIYTLYCVNKDNINRRINKEYELHYLYKEPFYKNKMDIFYIKYANDFIKMGEVGKEIVSLVFPIESQIYSDRLSRQQGLFLMPTNLKYSFEKNLLSTFQEVEKEEINFSDIGFDELISHSEQHGNVVGKGEHEVINILKFEIKSPASDILYNLKQMNITAETLFGGLEGFSKSLPQKHIL